MIQVILCILLTIPTLGQSNPADDAWKAYLSGNFDRVEQLVTSSVGDSAISTETKARLFLALGCSEALRGRTAAATTSFERALSLDPSINLTSAEVPPPVWNLYQPIRERMPGGDSSVDISKLIDADKDRQVKVIRDTTLIYKPVSYSHKSALKSLMYPGWGHIAEKRKNGWWLAGMETVLAAGWLTSAVLAHDARSDYLKSRDLDDIKAKYDRYNDYYRLSWGFGVAALAGYIGTQVSFFGTPPILSADDRGLSVGLTFKL